MSIDVKRLQGLCVEHPILSLVNTQIRDHDTFQQYLQDSLSADSPAHLPNTLTKFYKGYLDFNINRHLQDRGGLSLNWESMKAHTISNVTLGLGQLAWWTLLKKRTLLPVGSMGKYFPGVVGGDEVTVKTLGIIQEQRKGKKERNSLYSFKEPALVDYLAACHQVNEIKDKMAVNGRGPLPSKVKESLRLLPATANVWRMTFGLLSGEEHSVSVQKQLFDEVTKRSRKLQSMTSPEVSSLCLDLIYESENHASLAKKIDDFTVNQTMDMSRVAIPNEKKLYTANALGYLIREAGSNIYGLNLKNYGLDETHLQALSKHLHGIRGSGVQNLNISHNNIGPDKIRQLIPFLSKSHNLTHLDMTDCGIGPSGCEPLGRLFSFLPLVSLGLSQNNIADEGLENLLHELSLSTNLENVELAENGLTDGSVAHLGKSLENLTNLRSVDLSGNSISDGSCAHIASSLHNLGSLSRVNLSNNRISDEGVMELSGHVESSKSIKNINLVGNSISFSGKRSMTKATGKGMAIKLHGQRSSWVDIGQTCAGVDSDPSSRHFDMASMSLSQLDERPSGKSLARLAHIQSFSNSITYKKGGKIPNE